MDRKGAAKLNVEAEEIEKRSSWSDATSPTATSATTDQTIRTQHHVDSSPEPKTPPTKRAANEEDEHDSLSIMTPSQPLHDKLEELEERWSEKRRVDDDDDAQYMFAAGGRILHQPSRPKAASKSLSPVKRTPVRKQSVPVEIIGSPDEFRARRGENKKQSVFDRLYRQGQSSSSRKQRPRDERYFQSMPMPTTPQSSSIEGTISTLSSSESVFDRLYKNEKRNRADIPRSSRPLSSVASAREVYQSDSMSAAASLERRLAYAAPPIRRRNRVSSSGKVRSIIQQHESRTFSGRNSQPGTPRSNSSRSPRTPKSMDDGSVSSNADSVFDRLYRGEKRKTPIMPPQKTSTRPTVKARGTRAPSNSPSASDSVFHRLYKGEKRKTPLTTQRKRRLRDSATSQEDDTPSRTEESILEESLRDAGDSDDSLLLDDLAAPTVLSFAKYSSNGRELPQTVVGSDEAKGTFNVLGKEIGSDSVRDTLARLRLQFFVRRIQRCARAYMQRASRPDNKSSTKVQFATGWSEGNRNTAAVCLQRVWRGYRSRLKTLASLLDPSRVDFEFLGTNDYSSEMQSKIRTQILGMVMAFAGNAGLSRNQHDKREITVDWSKHVVFHFTHNGVAIMGTAVVSVKCSMVHFLFTRRWDSRSLYTMIVKSILLDNYAIERGRLVDAAIRTIQSWARGMIRKGGVSRRPGSAVSIKTSGLQYHLQYLTPTSLQRRSAITLQNAWRSHQSQVRAADTMMTSSQVKCSFETETTSNRILAKKVALHALSKAIGRVDCLWIAAPENVRVGDRSVVVKWEREVGVHYFSVMGVPHLETCTVGVDCEVSRSLFVDRWGRRKLAILVVKAALKRAILREESILAETSATLVQSWFRMVQTRASSLSRIDPCGSTQPSPQHKTDISDGLLAKASTPQSSDNNGTGSAMIHEHAAIVAQSLIRRFVLASKLQRRDEASRTIQHFVRQKFARRSIQAQEAAAILVIQSCLQSYIMKIRNERNNSSATMIQALWRGTTTHDAFHELKKATIVIQTWERRRQREEIYNEQVIAANVIQVFYRNTQIQLQADHANGSATRIQSAYRRHAAMFSFRKISAGVVALQAAYRGIMARRLIVLWHTLVTQSRLALGVQKLWRGNRVRKWYYSLLAAAIAIQSSYRRHYTRHWFLDLRKRTVVLQKWYRKNKSRRTLQAAAAMIQIAWRRSRRRANEALLRGMSIRENSATMIQRWYRCHEIRGDYLTLREAAVEIQAFERRRSRVMKYHRLQSRLIRVQAVFRGGVARREFRLTASSAQLIQTVWRGSRRQRDYDTMQNSVVRLQSSIRTLNAMTSFHKVISGVSLLQAIHRGQAVRNYGSRQGLAATKLQAWFRAERARRFFLTTLDNRRGDQMALYSVATLQQAFRARQRRKEAACVLIQKRYRSHLCRESLRYLVRAVVAIQAAERRRQALLKFNRLVRVVVCLQARQRGIVVREQQTEFCKVIEAAIFIQKYVKRHFTRQNYLKLRYTAVRIQCMERRRQSLAKCQHTKRAIVILQAFLRGHITRSILATRNDAAITVQRCYRGRHFRQDFAMLKHVVIQIQAVERRRQSLLSYNRAMQGIIALQARLRGAMARQRSISIESAIAIQRYHRGRKLRLSFVMLKQVAILIQKVERRRQSQSSYQRILRGCTKLQAHYRGSATRARLCAQSQAFDSASVVIQRCWRGYFSREQFRSTKNAALRIQTAERRRKCWLKYYRTIYGVVHLQACYRGFHVRKQTLIDRSKAETLATVLIQSQWRRFCSHREFVSFNMMAVRLQAQYRGFLIRRLLTELTAAVILQSFCRTIVPRRKFLVRRQAAVYIQTSERRRRCLQRYSRILNAIILFQARSRGSMARQSNDLRIKAALAIQTKWRTCLASVRYRLLSTGVIALQRAIRSRRATFQMHLLITRIILLQAIQRGVLVRRDLNEQKYAAMRIQRAWKRLCHQTLIPYVDLANDGGFDLSDNLVNGPEHLSVGHSLDRLESAARKIQAKYFTWKMQLTLLMVQSSVVLLQRSVRGQLLRSAARFALSHINASLYSSVIGSFGRVTTSLDPGVACIWREWSLAVHAAREAASIVIQSACRRMLARHIRNELVAGQPTLRQFVSRSAVSAVKSIKTVSSVVSSRGRNECQEATENIEGQAGSLSDTGERLLIEPDIKVKWANRYDRNDSAIVIQRMIRRHNVLLQTRTHHLAACHLQKVYRRRLGLTKYKRFKAGIVCLQSRFRGMRVRSGVISMTHAIVRVQQMWRMRRKRREYLATLKLIIRVQSWYRMRSECRSFCSNKEAAGAIQIRFRSWLLGSLVRSDLGKKNIASVRIQQKWRVHRDCRRYLAAQKLALFLQAWHRMCVATHSFRRFKNAVLVLQTMCRARYARRAHLRHVGAAIKLQAAVRRLNARVTFRRARCSVLRIQRSWRVVALRQIAVTGETIDVKAEESPLINADTSVSALVDPSEYLERLQQSIVSQVDRKSRMEVSQLLEGNVADLESTGICIHRVACRTLQVQSRSSDVARLVDNQKIPDISSECNHAKSDPLAVEAMDTSKVEARESSVKMNQTPRPSNVDSAKATNDSSAQSTLDLASAAQELLLEARRARVRFQESRRDDTLELSSTPRTRAFDAKQESTLFGNCVDDELLPSPIKIDKEDWDWAKSWK